MAQLKIPLIYLLMHKRLKDKMFKKKCLEVKEAFGMFGFTYHINKKYNYPILKELENFKLIKRINKTQLVVLKNGFNINNTSKIYKSVGLY